MTEKSNTDHQVRADDDVPQILQVSRPMQLALIYHYWKIQNNQMPKSIFEVGHFSGKPKPPHGDSFISMLSQYQLPDLNSLTMSPSHLTPTSTPSLPSEPLADEVEVGAEVGAEVEAEAKAKSEATTTAAGDIKSIPLEIWYRLFG